MVLKSLQGNPLSSVSLNKEIESANILSAFKTSHSLIALKRNLHENIKVTHDSGPPHKENVSMKIPESECVSEEEHISPDVLKRDTSTDILEEERELPTRLPFPQLRRCSPEP